MKLKNYLAIIIMIIAILSTTKVEAATTQWKNYIAYKATADLVVRSGPGTGYSKVTTIKKGYPMSASDAVNGWRKINGKNQYVEAKKTTKVAWKNYAAYQVNITSGYLNVRVGPGSSYTATKKYNKGEVISVTEEIKGTDGTLWRKIRGKNELYVASSYLKKVSWGTATTYTVNQDLHAEYGPGEFYTDASTYKKGTVVRLTKLVKSPDGRYWRKVDGQELYIRSAFVTAMPWKNYKTYTITGATGALNARKGPGTNFALVTTYNNGTTVKASDAINGWRKIEGKEIYINSQYTKLATTSNTDGYYAYTVKVDDSLNIRKGAGTNYESVGSYKNGDVVYAAPLSNGWSKIYGETKYVNSSYLVMSAWVEVDISDQKVTLHKKNGTKYVSSCVTGNVSAGNATPTGVYNIYYKQYSPSFLGETLSGVSKYAKNEILLMGDARVGYWMPFNGSIGFHDASWRTEFGGTIYKTNGSHGCVNLPKETAKQIFLNIDQGTMVRVHN